MKMVSYTIGLLGLLMNMAGGAVAQTMPPHLHHDNPFTLPRSLDVTACFAQRKAAGKVVIRLNDAEDSVNLRMIVGTYDSVGTLNVLQVALPTRSYLATFDSRIGPRGLVLPPRVSGDSDYPRVEMSDTALVRARVLGQWLWRSPCRTKFRHVPPARRVAGGT